MAWIFLRLKIALLRNGLKSSVQKQIGFWIGAVGALVVGGSGFFVLSLARTRPQEFSGLLVPIFGVMLIGWIIFPILLFGIDETLDPDRLALLPLTPRRMMVGLLASSSVGLGAAGTMLALSGAFVGFAPMNLAAILVMVAISLQFALCVTACRAIVTALSGLLRMRRVRDLTFIAISVGLGSLGLSMQVIIPRLETGRLRDFIPPGQIMKWIPSGWVATSIIHIRNGNYFRAIELMLLTGMLIGFLLWWWQASLQRQSTIQQGHGGSKHSSGLFSGPLFPLPRNAMGAVAAKELRYSWREPRRRAGWISGSLPILFLPPFFMVTRDIRDPRIVLVAALAGAFLSLQINNFGADGAALWTNVVATENIDSQIRGKNLAMAILVSGFMLLTTTIFCVITGGWVYFPSTIGVGVGALAMGLAVTNVVSAKAPIPVPESKNPFAANTGQGCSAGLITLLVMAIHSGLMLPVYLLTWFGATKWAPGLILVIPVSLAFGYLMWRIGVRLTVDSLTGRQAELLAAVSPKNA